MISTWSADDRHMILMRPSHDHPMIVTWSSQDSHIILMWLSHVYHMLLTQLSHDHHMIIVWLLHTCNHSSCGHVHKPAGTGEELSRPHSCLRSNSIGSWQLLGDESPFSLEMLSLACCLCPSGWPATYGQHQLGSADYEFFSRGTWSLEGDVVGELKGPLE